MKKIRQGARSVCPSTGRHRRRRLGVLVLGLPLLAASCAQVRPSWRASFGMAPTRQAEPSSTSVAGRVAQIDAIGRRAKSMSAEEAEQAAKSIRSELGEETPAPVKLAAVNCLAKLPSASAMDGLSSALRDADPNVRSATFRALGEIDSPRSLTLLSEGLASEQDADARIAATRALGNFRDPHAVQALGTALDDRNPAVQYVAMQSLRQATGQNLGEDVRRWKEITEDPTSAIAGRKMRMTR